MPFQGGDTDHCVCVIGGSHLTQPREQSEYKIIIKKLEKKVISHRFERMNEWMDKRKSEWKKMKGYLNNCIHWYFNWKTDELSFDIHVGRY